MKLTKGRDNDLADVWLRRGRPLVIVGMPADVYNTGPVLAREPSSDAPKLKEVNVIARAAPGRAISASTESQSLTSRIAATDFSPPRCFDGSRMERLAIASRNAV